MHINNFDCFSSVKRQGIYKEKNSDTFILSFGNFRLGNELLDCFVAYQTFNTDESEKKIIAQSEFDSKFECLSSFFTLTSYVVPCLAVEKIDTDTDDNVSLITVSNHLKETKIVRVASDRVFNDKIVVSIKYCNESEDFISVSFDTSVIKNYDFRVRKDNVEYYRKFSIVSTLSDKITPKKVAYVK